MALALALDYKHHPGACPHQTTGAVNGVFSPHRNSDGAGKKALRCAGLGQNRDAGLVRPLKVKAEDQAGSFPLASGKSGS